MRIVVKRTSKMNDYTIGNLYIDGQFFCNTLEDTDRGLSDSQSLLYIKAKRYLVRLLYLLELIKQNLLIAIDLKEYYH